jgi:hypothetical protein
MVPRDWQHPKDESTGRYKPLYGRGYEKAAKDWLEAVAKDGLQETLDNEGRAPDRTEYMPEWPESEKTHLMMYENTSEGTPISPAFATPEELARWLADNGASSFGGMTASYEAWLSVAKGGYAPSLVISGGIMQSGVEASLK